MNKTVKKILEVLACVAVLLLLAFVSYYAERLRTNHLQQRIRDLEVQLAHATIPVKTDTIRDSIPVVTQQIITVDKTDYKKQLADQELIKDLKLRISEIQAENTMLREARDTVLLQPTEQDSTFSYHDPWADFEVNLIHRKLAYCVRDSFRTYINRIPKHKFLWWRWGTKGYQVKHVNFNRNVRVKYDQTIYVDE